ncbi:uncharacterized protein [Malus domestica]|uniref:uncharacterized protein isoform X2 n=1 Tax=Malus domestica TaxID=3750 RepID=UPI003974A6F7
MENQGSSIFFLRFLELRIASLRMKLHSLFFSNHGCRSTGHQGDQGVWFIQSMADRFSDGYIWSFADVESIVSSSCDQGVCFEQRMGDRFSDGYTLLMLRALSLAPLMVCHILEMGLSPRTAEEIFRDYSAWRTDVVHTLINAPVTEILAQSHQRIFEGPVTATDFRKRILRWKLIVEYMYIKKPPNLQRKQQNLKENSQERNSAGLKIAVTESLSCSSSSPPTKHPGEIEGQ